MTRPISEATSAKVLALLQSNRPKYTLKQIAQECGVSVSSVNRIKNKDRKDRASAASRPILPTLPIGIKNLKQAIGLANVCAYLGFDQPEAASYCHKANVDLSELKAFKEAYDRHDIVLRSEMQQQLRAANERSCKAETRLNQVAQSLSQIRATLSVLAQSIASGKIASVADNRFQMTSGLQRLQTIELIWDLTHGDENTSGVTRVEINPDQAVAELAPSILQLVEARCGDACNNGDESVSDDVLKARLAWLRQRIAAEPGKYAPRGHLSMEDACAMLGLKPRTIFHWLKLIRDSDENTAFQALVDKRTLIDHKGPATDPRAISAENRRCICKLAQRPEFEGLPISQRYHQLVANGELPCLCSKRTFYRVLEQEGLLKKL